MRKSFTLIELLISVVIISFIFVAMSNFLQNFAKSKDFLQKKPDNTLKVLYYDILNASEVVINRDKNFYFLALRTKNSLYKMPFPYVYWYVKNRVLVRFEAPVNIKDAIKSGNFYLDKMAFNVKIFKIYKSDGKYFLFLDSKKPIYFEMYKGF